MIQRPLAYTEPFVAGNVAELASTSVFRDLAADWAWGESTGAAVKVAVVDSGVDATNPAVGPVQGYAAFSEDSTGKVVCDEGPHEDRAGHGTACAGVIRSLAPACELYSVNVLNVRAMGRSTGTSQVLAAGLRWAIEHDMDVCNLSLGSTRQEFNAEFHDLVDQAYFRNIVLVTAANNMPELSIPSLYSSVISVAAHAIPDPYVFYYNPRPPVEFGAWGVNVRLAWARHTTTTRSGNSFAAPHIAGLVAKILGKHPGLTVFQVKSILRELASNVGRQHSEGAASPCPP